MGRSTKNVAAWLWLFGVLWFGIAGSVLLAIGIGGGRQAASLVARLEAARQPDAADEILVTGEAQPQTDAALVTAPLGEVACLAYETWIVESWTERDSEGRSKTRSQRLREGGAAAPFEVATGGEIYRIAEPALDLEGPGDAEERPIDRLPAWSEGFEVVGAAHGGSSLDARERRLLPGARVTLLVAAPPVEATAEKAPIEAIKPATDERMRAFLGEPEPWIASARSEVTTMRWFARAGYAAAALAIVCLFGLAWSFLRRTGRAGRPAPAIDPDADPSA